MADKTLSGIAGGGSNLKISSAGNSGTIATGTTADVTISCPTGKYINLTFLCANGSGVQGGVSLDVGARTVFASKGIAGESQVYVSTIKIGLAGTASDSMTSTNFLGGRDEDFVFSFDAATTKNLYYAYEVLEDV